MATRRGHVEIRPSKDQFKVLTVSSNGEIYDNTERLTSRANCLNNIQGQMNVFNGTDVKVRDYVTQGRAIQQAEEQGIDTSDWKEYEEYTMLPDGGIIRKDEEYEAWKADMAYIYDKEEGKYKNDGEWFTEGQVYESYIRNKTSEKPTDSQP